MILDLRVLLCGEPSEAAALGRALGGRGFAVSVATCAGEASEALRAGTVEIAVVDLDCLGTEAIRVVREESPGTEIVVVTSYDTADGAVQAMREGAADFVIKPFRAEELAVRLRRLAQAHAQGDELERVRALLGEDTHCPGILSDSPSMRAVCERIGLAVAGSMPVLLTGEPGTGKEFVARAIHARGPRRGRPWTTIACRAVPPGEVACTLAAVVGDAHGGTILLDDIDALPADAQELVGRVVAEGTLRRDAAGPDVSVDVRIVATTEVDLEQAAREGRFLGGLLRDLRGIEIHLPALRERGDDLLLLGRRFLRVLAARRAEEPKTLSPEAAEVLMAHPWPGNVGELRRVVAAAHASAAGKEIALGDLPDALRGPRPTCPAFTLHLDERQRLALPELVRQLEDEIRAWALAKAGGQPGRAAQILGEAPSEPPSPRRTSR